WSARPGRATPTSTASGRLPGACARPVPVQCRRAPAATTAAARRTALGPCCGWAPVSGSPSLPGARFVSRPPATRCRVTSCRGGGVIRCHPRCDLSDQVVDQRTSGRLRPGGDLRSTQQLAHVTALLAEHDRDHGATGPGAGGPAEAVQVGLVLGGW